ncbi:hypothetical protein JCM30760_25980 [Thiomicrorhabdus hydrogeniphila]
MNKILPIFLLGLISCNAIAEDLEVIHSKKISITVGANEHSMLDVLNRKVLHVDVDQSKCEVASERTKSIGKLVFKPASDKPFTIFLTDNHQDTYTVEVKVDKNKKPDLYTIKNVDAELKKKAVESAEFKYQKSTIKAVDLTDGHEAVILDLMRVMANGSTPKNVDIVEINQEFQYWNEARIVERNNYKIGNLIGISYELTNASNKPMVLSEAEFYPFNKDTLAVSIEKSVLDTSDKTLIYIVKSK